MDKIGLENDIFSAGLYIANGRKNVFEKIIEVTMDTKLISKLNY
jgi:hypothetical protein